ncbi:bifunctional 6-phosphofructo-2-kinase fructose-bisphosphate 2-phosphatase [Nannochloropsis oceanica]
MSEDIVPVVLYSLSAAGLLYVIRTRKHELIARKPDGSDASSPRVRGVSADHIVALEKSDKGALIDHPRRQALKTDFVGFSTMQRKLILVMVGLPARGKSYIVKMLIRYLTWTGIHAKVFNVGEFRRKLGLSGVDKSFFEANNAEAQKTRESMAAQVLDEAYEWLSAGGEDEPRVALFDATNTTRSRRENLLARNRQETNATLLFVESICDDEEILHRNYSMKLQNNDYKGMDPAVALADFKQRVRAYEEVYEELGDDEDEGQISYIKVYNVGRKVVTRNTTGYIPSQIAFYLQNIHIEPRKIWLTRHAESLDQVKNVLGRDSGDLTDAGRQYCLMLTRFIKAQQEKVMGTGHEVLILAGTQQVHHATIEHLQLIYPCVSTPLLNELRGGDLDGIDRTQLKTLFPEVWEGRMQDKLNYRYPGAGGESYADVIQRIRPIIVELERQRRSVLVVCHLAVQRCLYGYFMGTAMSEIPYLDLPKHVVIELTPGPFGTTEKAVPLFERDGLIE